ncbi:MAG: CBS domain-containing protein, partial [Vicinamibacteria bacterium]|nr:CBS domain-containing protein [Vicinamibacteria bacterium]
EDVIICEATDTLESAVRTMKDRGCGCVPVVDDRSRVVGLVTDRDAVMCALSQGNRLRDLRVAQACTRNVICCEAEDTLERAEMVMRVNQVRCLPVVADRRVLVGVISLTDLARHVEFLVGESGTGLSPRRIAILLAETSGVRREPLPPRREPGRESSSQPIIEPFFHG